MGEAYVEMWGTVGSTKCLEELCEGAEGREKTSPSQRRRDATASMTKRAGVLERASHRGSLEGEERLISPGIGWRYRRTKAEQARKTTRSGKESE